VEAPSTATKIAHNLYISRVFFNKLAEFTRRYPIPTLATLSLLVGTLIHWPFNQYALGQWIWISTLVEGGAPIVHDTFRGTLRKHFASDIVATAVFVLLLSCGGSPHLARPVIHFSES
jgi:hypothetical protein